MRRATHLTKLPLMDIIAWPFGNQAYADRAPASKDCHHDSPSLRLAPKPRSESSISEHSQADASKVLSQRRSHFVITCTDRRGSHGRCEQRNLVTPHMPLRCTQTPRGPAKVKIILVKANMILTFAGIIHSRVGQLWQEIVI
jgi:hypothetical protein